MRINLASMCVVRVVRALLCILCLSGAGNEARSSGLDIRIVAEVEIKSQEDGHEVTHLAPAGRVVPGDELLYTVEIRNVSARDASAPSVIQPVPEHTAYIADSATGPGADVTFSADGGATFAPAEALKKLGQDGRLHVVSARDYTHIRWQLKKQLKSKSVAFARFRAVVR